MLAGVRGGGAGADGPAGGVPGAPSDKPVAPPAFTEALLSMRGVRLRPEVVLQEIPAPTRLAPYAAALTAEVTLDAADLEPFVTWGTNPGQGLPISAQVPDPVDIADETERSAAERALEYMGLEPRTPIRDIKVDTVFIGSCTNGRIEDLRSVAEVLKGRSKHDDVRVLVVPGSARVRLQAEDEGLDKIFLDFGAEWRNAGCSMCLGMNPDQLAPGERAASTSNRNFEGRQGKGGRTHLVSPLVAAATAVRGTLSTVADLPVA